MSNTSFAQVQDNAIDDTGDIAFIAYAVNGTTSPTGIPGFAFVLLDNCPNNTSIWFTDDEWDGTSAFATGEGEIQWTNNTGLTIAKGTVIKFAAGPDAGGNITWTNSNTGVNIGSVNVTNFFGTGSGDLIFATTANRSGTFLAFIGNPAASGNSLNNTPFGSGTTLTAYGKSVTSGGAKYQGSTTCTGTVIQCNVQVNTGTFNNTGFTSLTSKTAFYAALPDNFAGSVLPVELTQFDVNTEGSKNHLTWRTESEKNNSHFDIERSTDGTTFHNIGQVKGNNKPSSYQFINNQPFATSYYRLRQIDFDGTETVSKIVSVAQTGKGKGLKVYPNPVSSLLTIEVIARNEATEGSDFQILNLLGQQVLTGKTPSGGRGLDVSALPQGTYFLKVGAEQAKFVKQ
jgi:Secretion system C-terminal sorting domain